MVVAYGANDIGSEPVMSGVQHTAQLFVVAEEGVRLVNEQRRSPFLNRSEQSGAGYVACRQGAGRERLHEGKHGRLATPFLGRQDCEDG